MISISPCHLPLCNSQMLIEDFSNAIYWRIAAIFSTIAALFSVAVVLWFLIFRDNPDLPDDTDSLEKYRFVNDFDKEKHNLLSEIIIALKNMTLFNYSTKNSESESSVNDKSPNFFQRLGYLLFGPLSDEEDTVAEDLVSIKGNSSV